jgi:hypothetical protein
MNLVFKAKDRKILNFHRAYLEINPARQERGKAFACPSLDA